MKKSNFLAGELNLIPHVFGQSYPLLIIVFFFFFFCLLSQHNIKKIRNNIQKSNKSGKPRCLTIDGKTIIWQQFKDAYEWDQQSFSLPLHEKLTPQHFDLDSASVMRNKLAEDVLDMKMLFLMQVNTMGNLLLYFLFSQC